MPGTYDRSIKVSPAVIAEMRKLGMAEAIKKANSGSASKEFVEGARRFYGGNKVSNTVGEPDASLPEKDEKKPKTPPVTKIVEAKEAPKTKLISSTKPSPGVQNAAKRATAKGNVSARPGKADKKSAPPKKNYNIPGPSGKAPSPGDISKKQNPSNFQKFWRWANRNSPEGFGGPKSAGPKGKSEGEKRQERMKAAAQKRLEASKK